MRRIITVLIRTAANIIIPLYFRITYKKYDLKGCEKRTIPVVISVTSFPKRISKLWIVIESLIRQSYRPNVIVLYLSKNQFKSISSLPKSLVKLQERGLKIKIVEGDFRSHKKYYYLGKDYPNAITILVDDDIIYPPDTIQSIILAHNSHPSDVICRYAHRIRYDINGSLKPYLEWDHQFDSNPSKQIFFGSGGGTLINFSELNAELYNSDKFMKICKYADDVWLNAFVRLAGMKVYLINKETSSILNIQIKNDNKLTEINVKEDCNDIQLNKVRNYLKTTFGKDPFQHEE